MRILFATAELAPFVKVGGLADASAGLVHALRIHGLEVDVVLPDYGDLPFDGDTRHRLDVPAWAGDVFVRRGRLGNFPSVMLVSHESLTRSNPYVDSDGAGWSDNDHRFFVFSAAIAALAETSQSDILHLNDWHTAVALGFDGSDTPSVLTIHNLAYQGISSADWLELIPRSPEAFRLNGQTNPLAGGIVQSDRVVTVSPTFAREVVHSKGGFGLEDVLVEKGRAFTGILNGIETDVWDPAADPYLPSVYGIESNSTREMNRKLLAEDMGWDDTNAPVIGMVTRLTDQKGVDIALQVASSLPDLDARMVILGSGDRDLADAAIELAERLPDHLAVRLGYDEALSHRIFGGSDLYLMPSRFEPGGLTQMQAMRYGSIPIVTDVGGLHDTVIDADLDPDSGNGFVAAEVDVASVADAVSRACLAWRSEERRRELVRRGMSRDWSWATAAQQYIDIYREITQAP